MAEETAVGEVIGVEEEAEKAGVSTAARRHAKVGKPKHSKRLLALKKEVNVLEILSPNDAFTKIKRFKDEEFPKILVSVNMLDTGFDCPEVVNLVMARFTESAILYQQMRGRGTRRADHIHKSCFTMFDFVGVTDFHGDDDWS